MRIKINDKIYRLKEIESGVDSLMELVEEPKQKYKDGDFLTTVGGSFFILKNICGSKVYDHAFLAEDGLDLDNGHCCYLDDIAGYCTPEEILKVIAALKKDGKRWNAEKKCVEDIPKRKFMAGDKVRIKDGVSSKSHGGVYPYFEGFLDQYIGKVMTVKKYITTDIGEYITTDEAKRGDNHYGFAEDWLEPYAEELKNGDLAIFWDDSKKYAIIRIYERPDDSEEEYFWHKDNQGFNWASAIKFESKEQFEKLIKGEI